MSGFVGLTFDDGPNPATTGPLLRVLGDGGARATFFDLGNRAAAYPDLVKSRVGAGMWHGNHSYTHPRLTDLTVRDAYRQITRTQRALRRATGEEPRLFRPPYGARDARTAGLVRRLGLTEVMWTVDTVDWSGIEPDLIARRASAVEAGGIVLLHEGQSATVAAIPLILAALAARGLRTGAIDPGTGRVVPPPD